MFRRTAVLALALVAAFGCAEADSANRGGEWLVVHVIDGDTLDVRDPAGREERVRLIGIDTPERGECGYEPATDLLTDLLLGRPVALVPGARDDRDRYGRLLRYVDVDGEDAGLAVLDAGLGITRYDSRDGYGSHAREESYLRADAATSSPVCPPTR